MAEEMVAIAPVERAELSRAEIERRLGAVYEVVNVWIPTDASEVQMRSALRLITRRLDLLRDYLLS